MVGRVLCRTGLGRLTRTTTQYTVSVAMQFHLAVCLVAHPVTNTGKSKQQVPILRVWLLDSRGVGMTWHGLEREREREIELRSFG